MPKFVAKVQKDADALEVELREDYGDVDVYINDIRVVYFSQSEGKLKLCYLDESEREQLKGIAFSGDDEAYVETTFC